MLIKKTITFNCPTNYITESEFESVNIFVDNVVVVGNGGSMVRTKFLIFSYFFLFFSYFFLFFSYVFNVFLLNFTKITKRFTQGISIRLLLILSLVARAMSQLHSETIFIKKYENFMK